VVSPTEGQGFSSFLGNCEGARTGGIAGNGGSNRVGALAANSATQID
jgi:hypothetical protein